MAMAFEQQAGESDAVAKGPLAAVPFAPAKNESAKAFECFLAYLDIGQNRSFAEVARRMKVNLNSVKMWANRYGWRERIRGYNAALLQARLAAETTARQCQAALWVERGNALKEKEWAVAEKLVAAAEKILNSFLAKKRGAVRPADAAKLLEVASKLGRLATGLATERQELTGEDGGPLQVELSAALAKVYGGVVEGGELRVESGNRPHPGPPPQEREKGAAAVVDAEVVGGTPTTARETRALPEGT